MENIIELNKVYNGDALEVLKTFPNDSINCCVTSPPYFGLRDYGTAQWDGGDTECDHVVAEIRTGLGLENSPASVKGGGHKAKDIDKLLAKRICHKCGATRIDRQVGLEETPEEYIERLVGIFREVRRVLRDDGTLWLNIGDSYAGSGKGAANYPENAKKYKQGTNKGMLGAVETLNIKTPNCKPKDLIGIPWMLAFALRNDGWWLRQDIIWHKPNSMPESVRDRCTKSHEYIFLLSKSPKYYYNNEAIKEPVAEATMGRMKRGVSDSHKNINGAPGQTPHSMNKPRLNTKNAQTDVDIDKKYEKRNKRNVWTVSVKPFKDSHFAVFPPDLIEPCILAGCPENGLVLDPFFGSGTVGVVSKKHNRNYIGIDLNIKYCDMAAARIEAV